jgi:hypothetical protein
MGALADTGATTAPIATASDDTKPEMTTDFICYLNKVSIGCITGWMEGDNMVSTDPFSLALVCRLASFCWLWNTTGIRCLCPDLLYFASVVFTTSSGSSCLSSLYCACSSFPLSVHWLWCSSLQCWNG